MVNITELNPNDKYHQGDVERAKKDIDYFFSALEQVYSSSTLDLTVLYPRHSTSIYDLRMTANTQEYIVELKQRDEKYDSNHSDSSLMDEPKVSNLYKAGSETGHIPLWVNLYPSNGTMQIIDMSKFNPQEKGKKFSYSKNKYTDIKAQNYRVFGNGYLVPFSNTLGVKMISGITYQ